MVEVEEAVAEAVSSILVKNILGDRAVAILSLPKYACDYNLQVLNEVMSLGRVPRRILSMLVKDRGAVSCPFLS